MTRDRHLGFEGCYNARDLGGLRCRDGQETRWGALVRSDSPARLTGAGWAAVVDYGIRTVVDLRNPDEFNADEVRPDARPSELTTVQIPLDGVADTEFWGEWGVNGNNLVCTPLYYAPFLDHFPQRVAEVFTAIARAEPGGVMFHCAAGRDRTGLISLLLLSLAGVEPEEIAADHGLSTDRLKPAWVALNLSDQTSNIERLLTQRGTTGRNAVLAALRDLDAEAYLLAAGVSGADVEVVRNRLR